MLCYASIVLLRAQSGACVIVDLSCICRLYDLLIDGWAEIQRDENLLRATSRMLGDAILSR